jgi:serine O-acetyltransferase
MAPQRRPDELLRLFASGGKGFAQAAWRQLRREAEEASINSPALAPLCHDAIISQPNLEAAIFRRVAGRLARDLVPQDTIVHAFHRAAAATSELRLGLQRDLAAVFDRDPACSRVIEPFLYFKGFHTLQVQRLAHWLWRFGERDFALYLQSAASEVFQTDIHPAAQIGQGLFLDHATGLVVGETTVIEDDVSILQGVTLGGTGKISGDRHPKIRRGAMIGAGAKILGNIEIGENARIAAGSVVLVAVPAGATMAGVPAKIVRAASSAEQRRPVSERLRELSYMAFDYAI